MASLRELECSGLQAGDGIRLRFEHVKALKDLFDPLWTVVAHQDLVERVIFIREAMVG